MFTPSKYQQAIFEFVANGKGHGIVNACAGSGKTTTNIEALKYVPKDKRVVFLAFNKHIATELKDRGVQCANTFHSLGRGNILATYPKAKFDQYKLHNLLDRIDYLLDDESKTAVIKLIALLKANLLEPSSDTINTLADQFNIELNGNVETVISRTTQLFTACLKDTDNYDFDDMIYWPAIGKVGCKKFDFIFVDECQDLNKAQITFAENSMADNGRMLLIGDPFQCQPAGTKIRLTGGKEKAIEEIQIGDEVTSYDRHGSAFVGIERQGRKVLDKSSRNYTGELVTVLAEGRQTICTPNHKWLTRFNTRSTRLNVVYLMQQGNRFRVGWCQLFNKTSSNHLAQRARIEHADKAWILSVHSTKAEASIHESLIATTFGLPTIPFQETYQKQYLSQNWIDYFFSLISEDKQIIRAIKCLNYFHRDICYPFWSTEIQKRQGRTTLFITEACNLIPEIMSIPAFENATKPIWKPIELEYKFIENETVYSLKIESHEMYIANGICTHNSIYAFRGAFNGIMDYMQEKLNAVRLPLSVSYRAPQTIVNLVNELFPAIAFEACDNPRAGYTSWIEYYDLCDVADDGDAIICRTNAPLVRPAFRLLREGRKAVILGRDIGDGLVSLIKRRAKLQVVQQASTDEQLPCLIQQLYEHLRLETPKLKNAKKLQKLANLTDQIETIVAIADGCSSIGELTQKVQSIFSNSQSGVVFSSVHKAKGLEWNNVFILKPEQMPHPMAESEIDRQQEENIKYVAYTRTRENLYLVRSPE